MEGSLNEADRDRPDRRPLCLAGNGRDSDVLIREAGKALLLYRPRALRARRGHAYRRLAVAFLVGHITTELCNSRGPPHA